MHPSEGWHEKARYRSAVLAESSSMPDKLDRALRAVESSSSDFLVGDWHFVAQKPFGGENSFGQ